MISLEFFIEFAHKTCAFYLVIIALLYMRLDMKKVKLLLLPLIASSLCSCSAKSSHYNSLMMISEARNEVSRLQFEQFEGNYVFKMKKTSDGEGAIRYSVSLGEGKADVLYSFEYGATKEKEKLLLTINGGEKLDGTFGYVEKGYKVFINIISSGQISKGDFHFEIFSW